MGGPAQVARASAFLRQKLPALPRAGVILGSGLGELDLGPSLAEIPYSRIPGFPRARVAGHPGRLSLVGQAAILRGRVHFYEGHSMEEVMFPVRVLGALGVRALVLTNAAGAVRPGLRPGDLMAITDHLNLMGENPLRGAPRFLDLSRIYDGSVLRGLKRGVYAAMPGPTYETPAEVRMLRKLGADAVGMSTVPEAVAAREAGMRVAGISVITNAAAGIGRASLCHEDVVRTARGARTKLRRVLVRLLSDWKT